MDQVEYNEDEWEECKESAFLWWWRVLATGSTVILAVLFYYYVHVVTKVNSKKHSKNKKEVEAESVKINETASKSNDQSSIRRRVVVDSNAQWSNTSSDGQRGNFEGDSWSKQNIASGREQNETRLKQNGLDTEDSWSEQNSATVQDNSDARTKSDAWTVDHSASKDKRERSEVTLQRQNNFAASDSESHDFNDFTVKVARNAATTRRLHPAAKTDSDSLSSDSWETVHTVRTIAHEKMDGLLAHDGDEGSELMRRTPSPGKPMFVSELKVKSAENEQNGKHESDEEKEEESTNIMLEIAKVETTEELLLKVKTLEAITEIMRQAGLESSNLIFGIDYTASNKYQGEESFDGRSLHAIEKGLVNPYQHVISILGKTLAPFASSGFIAAYGFGDVRTSDTDVFSFIPDSNCSSFDEVLNVYNKITPTVILSGPTNFAPLIYQAIKICKQVKDYHILVIVADGQVTNEKATTRAIVEACKVPLSIIVVGVGDGPWDMMRVFDEKLPKRKWDNFHFVEFHKVTAKSENPDLAFAIQALVEIPDQFRKIKSLGLLNFPEDDDATSNEE